MGFVNALIEHIISGWVHFESNRCWQGQKVDEFQLSRRGLILVVAGDGDTPTACTNVPWTYLSMNNVFQIFQFIVIVEQYIPNWNIIPIMIYSNRFRMYIFFNVLCGYAKLLNISSNCRPPFNAENILQCGCLESSTCKVFFPMIFINSTKKIDTLNLSSIKWWWGLRESWSTM